MAKKRGQGTGSITWLEDKKLYQARIDLGRDEKGKRQRPAKYFKLKKDAEKWIRESMNEVDNDTYITPTEITVGDWCDIWLREYKKRTIKPTSYRGRHFVANKYVKPELGKYKIKDLRRDTVQKFINALCDRGFSFSYINQIHATVHGFLEQAVDNGLIKENVAKKIKLPPKDAQASKFL